MSDFHNPLPGDEVLEVCVQRQTARSVPRASAYQVCKLMSTVLQANGLEEDSDFILVPALFTREGVHNGQLKPWEVIRDAAPTLVGTPFFINQPGEHEQGKWPPVDDQTRWHGIVAQVDVNEDARELTGLIALFKPEAMRTNGATEDRIRFQETLLKAAEMGGRFAISVAFGARIRQQDGIFKGVPYKAVEEKLAFNSVSLVPRGAEAEAVMNGFMGPPETQKEPSANESLYTDDGNRKDPTMPGEADTAWVRDASLSKLKELSPEVNRLVDQSSKQATEVAGLKGTIETLTAEANQAKQTTDTVAQILANALDPSKASELASTKPDALATSVANRLKDLETRVNKYVEAEASALQTRCEKAMKALSNIFSKEKVDLFYDENDLTASANRLEALAEAYNPGEIMPDMGPEANEGGAEEVEVASNRSFAAAERLSREANRDFFPTKESEN